MKFSASTTTLAGLLSISSLAAARIIGITLPKQLAAGQNFTAFLNTEDYIQSIADVSVAFGAAPAEHAYERTLGTAVLGEKALGPELSNVVRNISLPLSVSSDFQKGEAIVAAALFSLTGARYSLALSYFNVAVAVADVVADASEFVQSSGVINVY